MVKTKKTAGENCDRPQFVIAHAPIQPEHMDKIRADIERTRREHLPMIKRASSGLPPGERWEELVVNDLAGDGQPCVALIYSSKEGTAMANAPLLEKSVNREWAEFFGPSRTGNLHFTVKVMQGIDMVALALFLRQYVDGGRKIERELCMRAMAKVGAPPAIVKSMEVLIMLEEALGNPSGPCPGCGKRHGSKSDDSDSVEVPDGECAH